MGSKNTPDRSKKDSVTIREPIVPNGGGGRSRQDRIATTCEFSFHVKVDKSPLVKKDVPVSLQKAGPDYRILVLGSVVGKLNSKQARMVEACALLGVTYAGKIVRETKDMYARFTRIVR
jgi:hypothetical protein